MKTNEVPQEPGLDFREKLLWAQDEQGQYVTVRSVGWSVPNTSFAMYWTYVGRTLNEARERIQRGERSPLYYWMRVHQLEVGTLAAYVGMSRWRVRRHLTPRVFARLSPKVLARYTQALKTPVEQLQHVPEKDPESLPIPQPEQAPPE